MSPRYAGHMIEVRTHGTVLTGTNTRISLIIEFECITYEMGSQFAGTFVGVVFVSWNNHWC